VMVKVDTEITVRKDLNTKQRRDKRNTSEIGSRTGRSSCDMGHTWRRNYPAFAPPSAFSVALPIGGEVRSCVAATLLGFASLQLPQPLNKLHDTHTSTYITYFVFSISKLGFLTPIFHITSGPLGLSIISATSSMLTMGSLVTYTLHALYSFS
jgi:hypothetical protein